jgi:hypothetical protein
MFASVVPEATAFILWLISENKASCRSQPVLNCELTVAVRQAFSVPADAALLLARGISRLITQRKDACLKVVRDSTAIEKQMRLISGSTIMAAASLRNTVSSTSSNSVPTLTVKTPHAVSVFRRSKTPYSVPSESSSVIGDNPDRSMSDRAARARGSVRLGKP